MGEARQGRASRRAPACTRAASAGRGRWGGGRVGRRQVHPWRAGGKPPLPHQRAGVRRSRSRWDGSGSGPRKHATAGRRDGRTKRNPTLRIGVLQRGAGPESNNPRLVPNAGVAKKGIRPRRRRVRCRRRLAPRESLPCPGLSAVPCSLGLVWSWSRPLVCRETRAEVQGDSPGGPTCRSRARCVRRGLPGCNRYGRGHIREAGCRRRSWPRAKPPGWPMDLASRSLEAARDAP